MSRVVPAARMPATMFSVPTEYVSTFSRVNGTPSTDTTASAPATASPTAAASTTSAPTTVNSHPWTGNSRGWGAHADPQGPVAQAPSGGSRPGGPVTTKLPD